MLHIFYAKIEAELSLSSRHARLAPKPGKSTHGPPPPAYLHKPNRKPVVAERPEGVVLR
jgi:hypothetical protein